MFAVISGIIAGLLGGSNTYATSGNTATISDGNWNICVSATSYAGSSFVATVSGTGFDTQLVFDDFETEGCKEITLATGNDNTVTMNNPMGISGMSYEVDSVNNKVIFGYGASVKKFFNTFGLSNKIIPASLAQIHFDANGGSGTMLDMDNLSLNASVTLSSVAFTRTDYRFDSWNTKADGSGVSYSDEDTLTLTQGGVLTLYAQWEYDNRAILDFGPYVNMAIKTLANGEVTSAYARDSKVRSLQFTKTIPTGVDPNTTPKVNIAAAGAIPIYVYQATAEDYYIYTEADKIYADYDVSYLFNAFEALVSLNIPDWFDVSSATTMERMFYDLSGMTILGLPNNFDTSNVTDMRQMFSGCVALPQLVLPESFDTSNVQSMNGMFSYLQALTSLHLPNSFNTNSATMLASMFEELPVLTELVLPDDFKIDTSTMYIFGIFNYVNYTAKLYATDLGVRSIWANDYGYPLGN